MQIDNPVFTFKEAIFWLVGAAGLLIYRLLSWIMPKTYQVFSDHIRREMTRELSQQVLDLSKKVDEISKELISYKKKKHDQEGELLSCIEAIKNNDQEALETLRNHYKLYEERGI